MNTLLVLYLIYLSWGTAGQGRVSLLEMSRYLRISKTTCRNRMFALANEELVEIVQTFSERGSKKLFVALSDNGQDMLMQNFDAAIAVYHQHVAETLEIIRMRNAEQPLTPRKLSKKEREAIAAGQKDMFSYE